MLVQQPAAVAELNLHNEVVQGTEIHLVNKRLHIHTHIFLLVNIVIYVCVTNKRRSSASEPTGYNSIALRPASAYVSSSSGFS
jgi:hypothetical protein